MVCERLKLDEKTVAIVCTPRRRRRKCSNGICSRTATKECDYPVPLRGRTCDRPLCDVCAVNVGPNRDHCPSHGNAQAELAL